MSELSEHTHRRFHFSHNFGHIMPTLKANECALHSIMCKCGNYRSCDTWNGQFFCHLCGKKAGIVVRQCNFCRTRLTAKGGNEQVCIACLRHLLKWGYIASVENPDMERLGALLQMPEVPFKDHKPCGCNKCNEIV